MKLVMMLSLVLASSSLLAVEKINPAVSLIEAATVLSNSDLSCQSDEDCVAVAAGKRACGGPSSYIVASKLNQNLEEVVFLATQSVKKEAQFNKDTGAVSICSILTKPYVFCANTQCVQY